MCISLKHLFIADRDIIEDCIGPSGCYQWLIVSAVFLARIPLAWHLLCHGIMVPMSTPIYCINTSSPIHNNLKSTELKALRDEACSDGCPQKIISKKYYDNSLHAQFDLTCDRDYLGSTAQFLCMGGLFAGNNVMGLVADKWGRRHPFVFCNIAQFVMGACVAFAPNVVCFLIAKFVLNFFVGGSMMTSFVLYSEFMGAKWRARLAILQTVPFIFGHFALSLFAWLYREDWRWFQLQISLPSILFISFYFFVPESARWCIAKGKTEQGIKILERICKLNKKSSEHIRPLVEAYQTDRESMLNASRKAGCKELCSTGKMVTITLVMWVNWLSNACGFYGLAQYAGGLGNLYVDFIITALIQLPGILALAFVINRIARKWALIGQGLVVAVSLSFINFMRPYEEYIIIPTAIAIMAVAMSLQTMYVYSCELFPTVIRSTGMGTSSALGRVGGMLAAYVAAAKIYSEFIPPVTFATLVALATFLLFFLPETLHKPLPEFIEDVGNLTKKPIRAKKTEKSEPN